ncbi:MAG: clostripain-related cysteine peptidase [Prevotella sp.]
MNNKFTLLFLSIFCLFIQTGCSDDDNDTPPIKSEAEKTYTVMLLGCGGGNLDSEFAKDVPLFAESLSNNVNMVCQYTSSTNFDKANENYEPLGSPSTTYRFKVTPDLDIKNYDSFRYKSASEVPLYKDETVTDFINYAVETCPADEYILVLYNHGRGFDIINETLIENQLKAEQSPMLRSVLSDDNFSKTSLIEKTLSKAITNSKAPHMKALYFYACMEGMVECYSELYRQFDYIIGSAHVMSGFGKIVPSFLNHLGDSGATNFEEKVQNFMKDIETWWPDYHEELQDNITLSYNDDLTCIRTAQIEPLNSMLKRICDYLCSNGFYIAHKNAIDNVHANAIYRYCSSIPSYDMANYIHLLAESTNNQQLLSLENELNELLKQLFVSKINIIKMKNTPESISEFSLGINIYNKSEWENLSYDQMQFYKSSIFSQQTGWYRWFEKIEGKVTGWISY